MGPFVPDVFSNELNYVIAIIVGFAFGFILEQAGFSSSRKLAGVFYGYDFTVLKVFFTGAVTAMAGIILLNYFGLLNLDLIYVNPTYLRSAIVGGIIMGLGFIIGGFCPGTGICAATIGKIDAMFYIFGILLGILIFTIFYPGIEEFYKADFWGSIKVYESLGISRGLFAFLIILIAILAFVVTSRIEKNISKLDEHPEKEFKKNYYFSVAAALIIALILLFLPDWHEKVVTNAEEKATKETQEINYISVDELVFKIIDRDKDITIIDVRDPSEYQNSNIVNSINIPVDSMMNPEWMGYIKNNTNSLIFYSNDEEKAKKAYFIAEALGHDYNKVLSKGINYYNKIYTSEKIEDVDTKYIQNIFDKKFRTKARLLLEEIRKNSEQKKLPKKKKIVRISGGC